MVLSHYPGKKAVARSLPSTFKTMAVLSLFLKISFGFLATVLAHAAALQPRGTIPSDEIVGFAQTVPDGTVGNIYLAYKPDLYVVNGCVPFPAVNAAGDTKSVTCPH
jgi:hypothetical protein